MSYWKERHAISQVEGELINAMIRFFKVINSMDVSSEIKADLSYKIERVLTNELLTVKEYREQLIDESINIS